LKISLNWLQDFITWEDSPDQLAEKLTCLGLNVEGSEEFSVSFPDVVVAEVRESGPHPNADRLSVCEVFDGSKVHTVVCGAPNVRAGLKVLLAFPGAVLPNGIKLRKTKIRGVQSNGMICSASELQLGEDSQGIMELPVSCVPGTPADELYGYKDTVFDIEVTPNRPDWLSHLGVAREVAALVGGKVAMPPVWGESKRRSERLGISVEIEDFSDCPRYTAHGASKVQIGPSPDFIQNRLRAVGLRSISNVVDITNYVLFETGQPLHAFDREQLSGDRIVVRRASNGEELQTLDGIARQLTGEDLIIADAAKPVAIAGVMGGASSEVGPDTTEIVLESAFFAPRVVRSTSRRLGLSTDSSYRFEREADWEVVEWAAKRALYLLQKHAGAQVYPNWVDRQNPDRKLPSDIPLRVSQVNRLLGTDLDMDGVVNALQRLSLKVVPLSQAKEMQSNAANLMVAVPSFRRDLAQEVDLIEEIARFYGYENLVMAGRFRGGRGEGRRLLDQQLSRIRSYLVSTGYNEVNTSTFFSQEDLQRLELTASDHRQECLQIANPQHGGDVLLRTSLLPSFLRIVRHNMNADNPLPIRLFQINKVFWPAHPRPGPHRHEDERLLPTEPLVLQFGLALNRTRSDVGLPTDLQEIKGVLASLGQVLRVPLQLAPAAPDASEPAVEQSESYLVPGSQWWLMDRQGRQIGAAGRVAKTVVEAYDVEATVTVAEVQLSLLDLTPTALNFQPFSRYPAVKRDLSLVVPANVTFGRIQQEVTDSAGPHLESLELFDFYRGKEIEESETALGIRLKFRSDRGNLKGKTVDQALENIQKILAERLQVRLRT
jgi:phenylalanyl-tRNA synthetase beta chain